MVAETQIREIVRKIAEGYNPEKIILFGSYAKGQSSDDSDLDMIVIKNTNLPKHKRGIEIRKLFYGLAISMDFKIYTNREFDQESNNPYSFLYSALNGSKVLYERKA
jgi:uncharacterized protein